MTRQVTFKTPRGSEISITLVTERENLSDHTVISACWEIEYRLNGKRTFGTRVDHAEVGAAIELDAGTRQEGKKTIVMTATAPIPADRLAEVDALLAEFKAGKDARHQAWRESELSPAVQLSNRLTANMDRANSDN